MSRFLSPAVRFIKGAPNGDLSAWLTSHGDLLVVIAMIAAIAAIIIPIPTFLISLFVIFNLAAALILLIVSLYLPSPTQLSSYPTILLITTLFRLCLSISVSRVILTSGHAGDVIQGLGQVTASGNLIVGAVMFLIILAVQFVVVAKGTERVAEVAARFTLDAMPGRQMSIDADMRAGLIPQAEARSLRLALQRESQLYGALDGAMKFVKNDAVATIIIALVNIVAGLATGILVKKLAPDERADLIQLVDLLVFLAEQDRSIVHQSERRVCGWTQKNWTFRSGFRQLQFVCHAGFHKMRQNILRGEVDII